MKQERLFRLCFENLNPFLFLGNAPEPQTNADGYVRLVASPPKQINIISSDGTGRLPLANLDDQGFFKPPKAQYSEKYLAGYEQLDFPEQDGIFPGNINPDLIDPDDYHQDRPSFQVSTVLKTKLCTTRGLGVICSCLKFILHINS